MISVIVPTRNRCDLLAQFLDSLTHQTLPRSEFEVIVVDNASTDRTAEVGREFAGKLPNLRLLTASEPGLHAGRHAGTRAAKGEVLVFADDDIEPLPTWLEAIVEVFADPAVGMAGGNNLPRFLAAPPDWLRQLWERRDGSGVRSVAALSIVEFPTAKGELSPMQVWGCNFPIRKEVLLDAGGFHPDAMPAELLKFRGDGETHVSRSVAALGIRCVFHASASVYHKVPQERMSFAYFRWRGFNQGISDSYTKLRSHGCAAAPEKPNLLRRIARRGVSELRTLSAGREMRHALREIRRGHREGYAFHQKAYREDAAVRDWVHKPHYW